MAINGANEEIIFFIDLSQEKIKYDKSLLNEKFKKWLNDMINDLTVESKIFKLNPLSIWHRSTTKHTKYEI